jgi:hypothetical protein
MRAHRAAVEGVAPIVLALLDERHREASIRELTPNDSSARASAHDDDLALDVLVGPFLCAMDLLEPTWRLERADDIQLAAHHAIDALLVEVDELVDEPDESKRRFQDRVVFPDQDQLVLFGRREPIERTARPRDGSRSERYLAGHPRSRHRGVKGAHDLMGTGESGFVGRGESYASRE